jgi:hypothetical protein
MVLTVWMEGHLRKEQQSRWPARAEILSRTHACPVDYASVVTQTKTTTQLMTSVCRTGHEATGPFHVYIVLCRFIIIHAHIIISSLLNNKTQRLPRKVKLSRASSFEYPSYTSGKGNLQMIKKTPHFVLNFWQISTFFVFFPSSRQNSTKPQHFTMCHYSAKQHSGIIYYISQQSHVMHQLVL